MSTILVLTGLSGSGKTTIAKAIPKKLLFKRPILFTTRPIRPGEINGEDYIFLTNKEYDNFLKQNKIICHEEFKVASGDIWKYGISKDDLNDNVVIAGTPKIVEELKQNYNNVVDIMIAVSDDNKRFERILNRNDNQSKAEIKRRDKDDKEIYSKYTPTATVFNDDKLIDTISEIFYKIVIYNLNKL